MTGCCAGSSTSTPGQQDRHGSFINLRSPGDNCSHPVQPVLLLQTTPEADVDAAQDPALRLATIEAAGQAQVPFTSGILIGIGETRTERVDSLSALHALHLRYGHIQVTCLSACQQGA